MEVRSPNAGFQPRAPLLHPPRREVVFLAELDALPDPHVEEHTFSWKYDRHAPAQRIGAGHLPSIHAVDADAPSIRPIAPRIRSSSVLLPEPLGDNWRSAADIELETEIIENRRSPAVRTGT